MFRSPRALTTLALAASLAGCAMPTGKPTTGLISSNGGGLTSNNAGGLISNKAGDLAFEGGSSTGGSRGASMSAPRSPAKGASVPAMADSAAGAPASVVAESGGASGNGIMAPVAPEQQQEALKAGAIDDNAKFDDYMTYLKGYAGPTMRPLDVSERHVLQIVDGDGHAVDNATVTVSAGAAVVFTGKSYANGELLFHPKAAAGAEQSTSFTVKATKGAMTKEQAFERTAEGVWKLALDGAAAKSAAKVDVLFLLDATGSMGGEIARLQDTISTVATRLQGLSAQPTVRFGLVAYRDQGEEYVTAAADFTGQIADFKASLAKVEAGGGGDKAEDVESGLAKAVNGASWSDDAVKLVFLVADAAPHVDYEQSTAYTASMKKAAAQGIKLFPIGCSGLEPEGEYAFRQMAQFTMGQYLFITRGGDELTGGGEASHTVDKFAEGRLDDIVVDLVKSELDGLGK